MTLNVVVEEQTTVDPALSIPNDTQQNASHIDLDRKSNTSVQNQTLDNGVSCLWCIPWLEYHLGKDVCPLDRKSNTSVQNQTLDNGVSCLWCIPWLEYHLGKDVCPLDRKSNTSVQNQTLDNGVSCLWSIPWLEYHLGKDVCPLDRKSNTSVQNQTLDNGVSCLWSIPWLEYRLGKDVCPLKSKLGNASMDKQARGLANGTDINLEPPDFQTELKYHLIKFKTCVSFPVQHKVCSHVEAFVRALEPVKIHSQLNRSSRPKIRLQPICPEVSYYALIQMLFACQEEFATSRTPKKTSSKPSTSLICMKPEYQSLMMSVSSVRKSNITGNNSIGEVAATESVCGNLPMKRLHQQCCPGIDYYSIMQTPFVCHKKFAPTRTIKKTRSKLNTTSMICVKPEYQTVVLSVLDQNKSLNAVNNSLREEAAIEVVQGDLPVKQEQQQCCPGVDYYFVMQTPFVCLKNITTTKKARFKRVASKICKKPDYQSVLMSTCLFGEVVGTESVQGDLPVERFHQQCCPSIDYYSVMKTSFACHRKFATTSTTTKTSAKHEASKVCKKPDYQSVVMSTLDRSKSNKTVNSSCCEVVGTESVQDGLSVKRFHQACCPSIDYYSVMKTQFVCHKKCDTTSTTKKTRSKHEASEICKKQDYQSVLMSTLDQSKNNKTVNSSCCEVVGTESVQGGLAVKRFHQACCPSIDYYSIMKTPFVCHKKCATTSTAKKTRSKHEASKICKKPDYQSVLMSALDQSKSNKTVNSFFGGVVGTESVQGNLPVERFHQQCCPSIDYYSVMKNSFACQKKFATTSATKKTRSKHEASENCVKPEYQSIVMSASGLNRFTKSAKNSVGEMVVTESIQGDLHLPENRLQKESCPCVDYYSVMQTPFVCHNKFATISTAEKTRSKLEASKICLKAEYQSVMISALGHSKSNNTGNNSSASESVQSTLFVKHDDNFYTKDATRKDRAVLHISPSAEARAEFLSLLVTSWFPHSDSDTIHLGDKGNATKEQLKPHTLASVNESSVQSVDHATEVLDSKHPIDNKTKGKRSGQKSKIVVPGHHDTCPRKDVLDVVFSEWFVCWKSALDDSSHTQKEGLDQKEAQDLVENCSQKYDKDFKVKGLPAVDDSIPWSFTIAYKDLWLQTCPYNVDKVEYQSKLLPKPLEQEGMTFLSVDMYKELVLSRSLCFPKFELMFSSNFKPDKLSELDLQTNELNDSSVTVEISNNMGCAFLSYCEIMMIENEMKNKCHGKDELDLNKIATDQLTGKPLFNQCSRLDGYKLLFDFSVNQTSGHSDKKLLVNALQKTFNDTCSVVEFYRGLFLSVGKMEVSIEKERKSGILTKNLTTSARCYLSDYRELLMEYSSLKDASSHSSITCNVEPALKEVQWVIKQTQTYYSKGKCSKLARYKELFECLVINRTCSAALIIESYPETCSKESAYKELFFFAYQKQCPTREEMGKTGDMSTKQSNLPNRSCGYSGGVYELLMTSVGFCLPDLHPPPIAHLEEEDKSLTVQNMANSSQRLELPPPVFSPFFCSLTSSIEAKPNTPCSWCDFRNMARPLPVHPETKTTSKVLGEIECFMYLIKNQCPFFENCAYFTTSDKDMISRRIFDSFLPQRNTSQKVSPTCTSVPLIQYKLLMLSFTTCWPTLTDVYSFDEDIQFKGKQYIEEKVNMSCVKKNIRQFKCNVQNYKNLLEDLTFSRKFSLADIAPIPRAKLNESLKQTASHQCSKLDGYKDLFGHISIKKGTNISNVLAVPRRKIHSNTCQTQSFHQYLFSVVNPLYHCPEENNLTQVLRKDTSAGRHNYTLSAKTSTNTMAEVADQCHMFERYKALLYFSSKPEFGKAMCELSTEQKGTKIYNLLAVSRRKTHSNTCPAQIFRQYLFSSVNPLCRYPEENNLTQVWRKDTPAGKHNYTLSAKISTKTTAEVASQCHMLERYKALLYFSSKPEFGKAICELSTEQKGTNIYNLLAVPRRITHSSNTCPAQSFHQYLFSFVNPLYHYPEENNLTQVWRNDTPAGTHNYTLSAKMSKNTIAEVADQCHMFERYKALLNFSSEPEFGKAMCELATEPSEELAVSLATCPRETLFQELIHYICLLEPSTDSERTASLVLSHTISRFDHGVCQFSPVETYEVVMESYRVCLPYFDQMPFVNTEIRQHKLSSLVDRAVAFHEPFGLFEYSSIGFSCSFSQSDVPKHACSWCDFKGIAELIKPVKKPLAQCSKFERYKTVFDYSSNVTLTNVEDKLYAVPTDKAYHGNCSLQQYYHELFSFVCQIQSHPLKGMRTSEGIQEFDKTISAKDEQCYHQSYKDIVKEALGTANICPCSNSKDFDKLAKDSPLTRFKESSLRRHQETCYFTFENVLVKRYSCPAESDKDKEGDLSISTKQFGQSNKTESYKTESYKTAYEHTSMDHKHNKTELEETSVSKEKELPPTCPLLASYQELFPFLVQTTLDLKSSAKFNAAAMSSDAGIIPSFGEIKQVLQSTPITAWYLNEEIVEWSNETKSTEKVQFADKSPTCLFSWVCPCSCAADFRSYTSSWCDIFEITTPKFPDMILKSLAEFKVKAEMYISVMKNQCLSYKDECTSQVSSWCDLSLSSAESSTGDPLEDSYQLYCSMLSYQAIMSSINVCYASDYVKRIQPMVPLEADSLYPVKHDQFDMISFNIHFYKYVMTRAKVSLAVEYPLNLKDKRFVHHYFCTESTNADVEGSLQWLCPFLVYKAMLTNKKICIPKECVHKNQCTLLHVSLTETDSDQVTDAECVKAFGVEIYKHMMKDHAVCLNMDSSSNQSYFYWMFFSENRISYIASIHEQQHGTLLEIEIYRCLLKRDFVCKLDHRSPTNESYLYEHLCGKDQEPSNADKRMLQFKLITYKGIMTMESMCLTDEYTLQSQCTWLYDHEDKDLPLTYETQLGRVVEKDVYKCLMIGDKFCALSEDFYSNQCSWQQHFCLGENISLTSVSHKEMAFELEIYRCLLTRDKVCLLDEVSFPDHCYLLQYISQDVFLPGVHEKPQGMVRLESYRYLMSRSKICSLDENSLLGQCFWQQYITGGEDLSLINEKQKDMVFVKDIYVCLMTKCKMCTLDENSLPEKCFWQQHISGEDPWITSEKQQDVMFKTEMYRCLMTRCKICTLDEELLQEHCYWQQHISGEDLLSDEMKQDMVFEKEIYRLLMTGSKICAVYENSFPDQCYWQQHISREGEMMSNLKQQDIIFKMEIYRILLTGSKICDPIEDSFPERCFLLQHISVADPSMTNEKQQDMVFKREIYQCLMTRNKICHLEEESFPDKCFLLQDITLEDPWMTNERQQDIVFKREIYMGLLTGSKTCDLDEDSYTDSCFLLQHISGEDPTITIEKQQDMVFKREIYWCLMSGSRLCFLDEDSFSGHCFWQQYICGGKDLIRQQDTEFQKETYRSLMTGDKICALDENSVQDQCFWQQYISVAHGSFHNKEEIEYKRFIYQIVMTKKALCTTDELQLRDIHSFYHHYFSNVV